MKPTAPRDIQHAAAGSLVTTAMTHERGIHGETVCPDLARGGVFGAAASQSVYWGFKRPNQHLEYDAVPIEYRWANNQIERLPPLAADLVRRRVAFIATTGGPRRAGASHLDKKKVIMPCDGLFWTE
jgi:hypothetical protein